MDKLRLKSRMNSRRGSFADWYVGMIGLFFLWECLKFIIRILFLFKSGYLYRRSCGKMKSAWNRAQKSLGNESGKVASDDFAAESTLTKNVGWSKELVGVRRWSGDCRFWLSDTELESTQTGRGYPPKDRWEPRYAKGKQLSLFVNDLVLTGLPP